MKVIFLIQIKVFFLAVSIGLSQDISIDSLDHYYEYQLHQSSKTNLEKNRLIKKVEGFPTSKISQFSDFKKGLELIALCDHTEDYELGIHLISKMLTKTTEEDLFQGFLYYKKAHFHDKLSRPIKALEAYLQSSSILSKLSSFSLLAHIYHKIALINLNGWNNEIGITYAEKGLHASYQIKELSRKDSVTIRALYETKGIAHRRNREFKEALFNIDKALGLSVALKDSIQLALNNGNKATIYYEKGDYDLAIPLLKKDFEASIDAEVYSSGMNALIYLGWIYFNQEETTALMNTFKKMQEIKERYPISDLKTKTEYLKLAAKVSELNGDINKANQYLREYIVQDRIRDSVNTSKDVASLHERHLMQQEISQLEMLQNTNQLQASHLKLRTVLLIIIAIALLVVLWYAFTLKNKNRKIEELNGMLEAKVSERNARLLETNKELDTYLYRASHDIRRPIKSLLGLNNIAQITSDPVQMKELFSKVHTTALSMDKMLFKLQMAYELNNPHKIEKVDIEELIGECLEDMTLEIKEHDAQMLLNINAKTKNMLANKALLRIAIDNILENALLYKREEQNKIEIFTDTGKYFNYIHIRDTGYGIPEKYHDELFKPYFKISNKTQGSGLGLFLAQKAVSFLGGEITVVSTVNEGSQFTIKLPLSPK